MANPNNVSCTRSFPAQDSFLYLRAQQDGKIKRTQKFHKRLIVQPIPIPINFDIFQIFLIN